MDAGRTWKLYYGDGSTFSDADGPPEAAPALNLQAIAQVADPGIGRRTCSGYDYYWFEPATGEWNGSSDLFALWDYLVRQCPSIVKFSRVLPRLAFQAILTRAVTDPDLQLKVAWDTRERQ